MLWFGPGHNKGARGFSIVPPPGGVERRIGRNRQNYGIEYPVSLASLGQLVSCVPSWLLMKINPIQAEPRTPKYFCVYVPSSYFQTT